MSSSLIDHVRGSWRILVKEIAAFGLVGALGFIIDLSLFNLFFDDGQIIAKTISTTVATVVTYVGNRYLSFSHRARSKLGREAGFFFLINLIALLGALVIIGIFSYPLHFKHHLLVMNVVNLFTIGLGTVFRFWAYKRFVFLHPDRVAAGLPDRTPAETAQHAAVASGPDEHGPHQLDTHHFGTDQLGTDQLGTGQLGTGQLGTGQLGTGPVDPEDDSRRIVRAG